MDMETIALFPVKKDVTLHFGPVALTADKWKQQGICMRDDDNTGIFHEMQTGINEFDNRIPV